MSQENKVPDPAPVPMDVRTKCPHCGQSLVLHMTLDASGVAREACYHCAAEVSVTVGVLAPDRPDV